MSLQCGHTLLEKINVKACISETIQDSLKFVTDMDLLWSGLCTVENCQLVTINRRALSKNRKFFNSNILVMNKDMDVNFQIWYLHTHMYLFSNFSLTDWRKKVTVTNRIIYVQADRDPFLDDWLLDVVVYVGHVGAL